MMGEKEVEKQMLQLIDQMASRLTQEDVESMRSLTEHREWGVAYEIMCDQLYEYEACLTALELARIKAMAARMGMSDERWKLLTTLVE